MADTETLEGRERGRPSEYTPEIASKLCAELSTGRTLRDVCRDDGMPPESTVRGWVLDDREGFAAQYTRARELGYHSMADETLEISDDGSNDWMERGHGEDDPVEVVNHEAIARSRLRVDTRKWLLSKALPKIYGERVTNIHEGGDKPVQVDGDDRDVARRVAFLLTKGERAAE